MNFHLLSHIHETYFVFIHLTYTENMQTVKILSSNYYHHADKLIMI